MVLYSSSREDRQKQVGADYGEGPPVPIPNTEVKLVRAEDTWLATARENRFLPTQKDQLRYEVGLFEYSKKQSRWEFNENGKRENMRKTGRKGRKQAIVR